MLPRIFFSEAIPTGQISNELFRCSTYGSEIKHCVGMEIIEIPKTLAP